MIGPGDLTMTIRTSPPPAIWLWRVFGKDAQGNSLLDVVLHWEVSLWRRVLTSVLLGSVWERVAAETNAIRVTET